MSHSERIHHVYASSLFNRGQESPVIPVRSEWSGLHEREPVRRASTVLWYQHNGECFPTSPIQREQLKEAFESFLPSNTSKNAQWNSHC